MERPHLSFKAEAGSSLPVGSHECGRFAAMQRAAYYENNAVL
jgi:hypothetical protein